MNDFGLKTTLYDILGYVIPGIVLVKGNELIGGQLDLISNGLNELSINSPYVYYFVISYVVGHIASYLSNVTIERLYRKTIKNDTLEYLNKSAKIALLKSFKKEYKWTYSGADFYGIANAVSEGSPKTYDNAFHFLSFYGMARSLCFVLIVLSAKSLYIFSILQSIVFFVCAIILYNVYVKFFRIYHIAIYYGFISLFIKNEKILPNKRCS